MDKLDKLTTSIPSSNLKVIELYNKIDSGNLIINPNFQRKLVWKKQHKFHFIETILKNFPFPEVYIASSSIDVENLLASEIVVDGQQRLSTIVDYIKGQGDFVGQKAILAFKDLDTDSKKDFLNYMVSVRDLKDLHLDDIKDIFKRINNTEYSLNAVEKKNAQYGDGEFMIFCKQIVELEEVQSNDTEVILDQVERQLIIDFWIQNNIFTENDSNRMIALQYVATLITTMLEPDYFHRNSKTMDYIEKYNNEFVDYISVFNRLKKVIEFIVKLKLEKGSYWYNKPNIFTLIVELNKIDIDKIDPVMFKEYLDKLEEGSVKYFANIEIETISDDEKKYFEYAKQGINDKNQRLHRAKVVSDLVLKALLK
ncbi:DUF262 domain-containing protein [Sediminibacterium sp.]|uniref:DUF262 domain-containing protein n=1 Tax=Sediminibacterium sp. TaxID=1917865 RepID=UPI0025DDD4A1|nr:DUF262 domain-containing protein [Sediminibacterium sp.]MBT9483340.1 DUF262 domain-containing protein [Sediminibacterium sp.]